MAQGNTRVPRLVAGVDLTKLPLSPLEGFVLSRIDGLANVVVLTDLTNLDENEVVRFVARLIELGAVEWAREAESRGAGEILLTSIDRDGTKAGFDCEMTAAVSHAVSIPVIASGGAGTLDHFVEVFTRGAADAALAASIFHYAETSVHALKTHLKRNDIPVRL